MKNKSIDEKIKQWLMIGIGFTIIGVSIKEGYDRKKAEEYLNSSEKIIQKIDENKSRKRQTGFEMLPDRIRSQIRKISKFLLPN